VFSLHQITHIGVSPSRGLKLFGREIIFQVLQPVWKTYLSVRDGQTTYCGITALCIASRGKKYCGREYLFTPQKFLPGTDGQVKLCQKHQSTASM